jgi:hypothetical protein
LLKSIAKKETNEVEHVKIIPLQNSNDMKQGQLEQK